MSASSFPPFGWQLLAVIQQGSPLNIPCLYEHYIPYNQIKDEIRRAYFHCMRTFNIDEVDCVPCSFASGSWMDHTGET